MRGPPWTTSASAKRCASRSITRRSSTPSAEVSPLYGPIPPLDPGYEDLSGSISYNPDRARELLAEAGAENLTLTLTIPSVYPSSIATFLVSSFADVGVTLRSRRWISRPG